MNCEQAEGILFEEAGAWSGLRARLHGLHCGACRRAAAERREIARTLALVPQPAPPAHVIEAWKESMPLSQSGARSHRRGTRRLALAAALVAVGAGGLVLFARVQQMKAPTHKWVPLRPTTGALPKPVRGVRLAVVTDPLLASDVSHASFVWWPDGRSVVYATRREGSTTPYNAPLLWRLDLDTGRKQLLVEQADGWIFDAEVDPTGRHVLYMDGRHLQLLDVASGRTRTIPESFGTHGATWSPDGQRIAFARTAANDEAGRWTFDKPGLWVWPVAGGNPKQLVRYPLGLRTLDDGQMWAASWSPDGRWIAYVWQRGERTPNGDGLLAYESEIWLIRPDGSERHRLATIRRGVDDARLFSDQCWSPDSQRLVFTWTEAVGKPPKVKLVERGVTTLDVYTGELTSLGPRHESEFPWLSRPRPTWSPNSEHIAFALPAANSSEPPHTLDLHILSTEDGKVVPVTSTGDVAYAPPVWSPDGRALIYLRQFCGRAVPGRPLDFHFELWLVELAPTEPET